ncbi:murein biosynthesis integral membrane protein MurJ [candidate division KSB3 bacterium]|uniref:Probable lipid II flippase MurJ n=1 Tax=candidate division KSB3 bacterium TaxID=2044937 RepID=A0A2G6E8G5_9BACT|nr:MAG: murein biosynthesis integral membrane protein MurJ [candidate division KSB3 bacterium]PIE30411.1 MAG: murein biosynthesis integral membrane protein MurJ [candidate division KSB3 bacterium]
MSSRKQVTKAAGVVGLATMATRILGFVRDMVIALLFGASLEADAFFVAFRIPNILRRLVGEGALTAAFIPVFIEERHQSEERAWALTNTAITFLTVILLAIVVLGIIVTPLIVKIIAPGFEESPEKFSLTIRLTRITFPYIFFISLAALAMGVLNSQQHFLSSALAPAMLNLTLITGALFLCPQLETPVIGLAIGVIAGGFLQLLCQIPALVRRGFRYRISFDSSNPAVRKIGLLLLPTLFGLAVHQISIFVNTRLASLLPEGSVSYLYYAYRLVEFPLGIFVMAVATAVLPTMSVQSAKGDYAQVLDTLNFALRLVLCISIPSMAGLIVLRVPIITWLFERGEFTSEATHATAQALFCYALALFPIASGRIIVPVFYALKDTSTPVKCATASVGVNILCSLLLMGPMKHNGLALATSVSSFFYTVLLVRLLRNRLGSLGWRSLAVSGAKALLASLIMGACCYPLANRASQYPLMLLAAIFLGMMVFLICVWVLKLEELHFLYTMLRQRLKTR